MQIKLEWNLARWNTVDTMITQTVCCIRHVVELRTDLRSIKISKEEKGRSGKSQ